MKKILSLLVLLLNLSIQLFSQQRNFDQFIQSLQKGSLTERNNLVDKYLKEIKKTPVVEGKNKVHFTWYGQADSVKVEGDIQKAWAIPDVLTKIDCGTSDFFYRSYQIPSDALITYNFIIDGKHTVDLRNPSAIKGFDFTDRSIFSMPDFKDADVKDRPGIGKGSVLQWTFKTKHELFTNQPIWIYRPFNYSESNTYPVLYVLDGASSLYGRPYLNIVNNLIDEGKIEPIVMVFVNPEERWMEYVEKSEEYSKWMVDEVVPFIEKYFKVDTRPSKRGIIGASAAGHGAMIAALRHPDVFGNVASQGGGAGGYPGLNPYANKALDFYITQKDKTSLRTLYTEVGAFDLEFPADKIIFSEGVKQFNKRLTENKIPFVFKEINGGHNNAIWDQNLETILKLFFGTESIKSK